MLGKLVSKKLTAFVICASILLAPLCLKASAAAQEYLPLVHPTQIGTAEPDRDCSSTDACFTIGGCRKSFGAYRYYIQAGVVGCFRSKNCHNVSCVTREYEYGSRGCTGKDYEESSASEPACGKGTKVVDPVGPSAR